MHVVIARTVTEEYNAEYWKRQWEIQRERYKWLDEQIRSTMGETITRLRVENEELKRQLSQCDKIQL